jgi:N-acetylglucosamine-6-phosphate deacetylase
MVQVAEVPLTDAVRMITQTPASILGLSQTKGALVAGKDADIVIFDDDIQVEFTMVKGRTVYQNQKHLESAYL